MLNIQKVCLANRYSYLAETLADLLNLFLVLLGVLLEGILLSRLRAPQ